MEKMLLLLSCIHAISKSHLRCPQNLSQRHPFLSTATVILLLAHCWTSWFPASSLTFYRLFPHSSHNELLETRKILGCSFAQDLPVSSHHTYDKIQAAPHGLLGLPTSSVSPVPWPHPTYRLQPGWLLAETCPTLTGVIVLEAPTHGILCAVYVSLDEMRGGGVAGSKLSTIWVLAHVGKRHSGNVYQLTFLPVVCHCLSLHSLANT